MPIAFEANSGFRLMKNGKSVILKHISMGKPGVVFTDDEVFDMAMAFGNYIDTSSTRDPLPYKRLEITPAFAPPLPDDVAYKFTDDDGVRYWTQGNIKVTPLHFYHEIENMDARDEREGFGFVHLQSSSRDLNMSSLSGFNSLVICTSADARRSERKLRHEKFGPRLIKINGVSEFSERIAELLNAERYVIRDLIYSDVKTVRGESDLPDLFFEANGKGDMKEETLHFLANNHLEHILKATEAASAFTKPNRYRNERERRLLFAMPEDVNGPRFVQDRELTKHIEVIT